MTAWTALEVAGRRLEDAVVARAAIILGTRHEDVFVDRTAARRTR